MAEDSAKRYWKSLPMRDQDTNLLRAAEAEFPEPAAQQGFSRRDFLGAAGFALTGVALTGCGGGPLPRAPVQHALPPVAQPPEATPGRSLYYASTCGACTAGCGLLVKVRDGRPIKLEGNADHPLSTGGLCAVGQASLLGLYDRLRLQHPLRDGQQMTWDEIDRGIRAQLDEVRRQNRAVRVLSHTLTSPTTRALIGQFLAGFADGRHVVYDPLSCSAILDAHERTHGVRVLPRYHFDRAEVIVSFDADFLGTWIAPVEFTAGYRAGRSPEGMPPRCSYHVQFEARLSLTGSKADRRVRLAPGELGVVLTHLARRVAARLGRPFNSPGAESLPQRLQQQLGDLLDRLTIRLTTHPERSLVISGSQDVAVQVLCNYVNHLLESYGSTLDIEQPSYQRQGSDAELERLLRELREGRVGALFLIDCNPVYDLPAGQELANLLRNVRLVVSCGERLDETAQAARYVCPHPHYLASWNDAEPVSGLVSLTQPTMRPLGDTRPVLESLAVWIGAPRAALELLQEHWRTTFFPRQVTAATFQDFWDQTLHDGGSEVTPQRVRLRPFNSAAAHAIAPPAPPAEGSFALVLYPKVAMLDGGHAYNPWLQELPDPISKVAWDNYACLSPAAAERLGVRDGDMVRVETEGNNARRLELPVLVQPGQHDRVVAVALGYGSKSSERFANVGPQWLEARPAVGADGLVGKNAAPLLRLAGGALQYVRDGVRVTRLEQQHPLASTQQHHTINVPAHLVPPGRQRRPMIEETTLAAYAAATPSPPTPLPPGARGARQSPLAPGGRGVGGEGEHPDLWPQDHPVTGHRWGMVIDLNACTGCSACVIACQVENNIPVVGKDEVRRQREMHWLRIDRYYSGDGGDVDVAFQPMLCQHCGNAPCETVCPVLATVHSSEGLNQQIYNRCVGTRYCANNCPYKVRRFNWFDYPRDDTLQNLVLNPDVTVRSRGVMEKCTFCVQRIQEARLEARRLGLPLADGDIQPACQQACPAQAIVFGDLNDPRSRISRRLRDRRRYQVLAELNVRPSVSYLGIVRHRTPLTPNPSPTRGEGRQVAPLAPGGRGVGVRGEGGERRG
ncbi:MAG: TAT-variant-translocated molybdopterin oxidoreductase [Gemmataceae bacterium]|nr:TAT-variant-translocated molybdopterin oxidoreductase [Gemmataceae bacterium]